MKESLIANLILEIVKGFFKILPNAINSYRFKKFFGKNAFQEDKLFLTLDPYEHPTPRSQVGAVNRYVKNFHGRKANSQLIGEDKVLGSCASRVIKYTSIEFGRYRKIPNPINVELDENVMNNWDGTFICSGSSDSNIKTYGIEQLNENNLYSFNFAGNGLRCFDINGQIYQNITNGKDIGVLARLKNPYHENQFLFVCAGLGEWGTSGAAYYLFKNWKKLYKRFKDKKNFCLILEVNINSDDSAREIREYTT